tara:strand:- start:3329 stop:5101 length:1773 start_codon:yes stop_codon:yes gene_type:complete
MPDSALIYQLKIERFRGVENLRWNPSEGMNVILGGGDVGKTTILEAIALLLSPSNSVVLSEADYWLRNTDSEFIIQGILSLPPSSEISQQSKFAWPWEWNGEEAVPPIVPDGEDDDIPTPSQPVYRVQVRGTNELEVNWEIVQPNDDLDTLSAAVRRKIGVVRLGGEERNDRDLRLVYGSALDRLLADKGLRARIGQEVSGINLQDKLSDEAKKALQKLDKALAKEALPNNLELGLTSSQGLSIGALVGLLAEREKDISLPLASWGAGTRRMATLQIAVATEAETRITVIDEIERGLEPYRVRKLVRDLQSQPTQSFVTTHSAVAISAAAGGHLCFLDHAGNIGHLPREKIARQQDRDPETFLSRLAIIAEGPTEIGFLSHILERAIDGDLADHGLRVCDGQGNESTLGLLEAMAEAKLIFAGFADDEGKFAGRWATLKTTMGSSLFRWDAGCTEENVLAAIDDADLPRLITDADADVQAERRITLANRLGIEDRSLEAIVAGTSGATPTLQELIVAAATGNKEGAPDADLEKTWKKHGQRWFKSETGGRELAAQMFALNAWPQLKPRLLPFINAIRNAVGQTEIQDVTP